MELTQDQIDEGVRHLGAALRSLGNNMAPLAINTAMGATVGAVGGLGAKTGMAISTGVTGALMAKDAYKAYKRAKNKDADMAIAADERKKTTKAGAVAKAMGAKAADEEALRRLTKEETEFLETYYKDVIAPMELKEQARRDQIVELFKKSLTEEPAAVEELFQTLVQETIRDMVDERKKALAENLFTDRPGAYPDEEEEDEDDEEEELDFDKDDEAPEEIEEATEKTKELVDMENGQKPNVTVSDSVSRRRKVTLAQSNANKPDDYLG